MCVCNNNNKRKKAIKFDRWGAWGELEEVYMQKKGKGGSDVVTFQLKTSLKEKRELEGNKGLSQ